MSIFWLDNHCPEIHDPGSGWVAPEAILLLAAQLEGSLILPDWVRTGPFPYISPGSVGLLSELADKNIDLNDCGNPAFFEACYLSSVFDYVLSTTEAIRRASSVASGGQSKLASTHIQFFLSHLMSTLWPNFLNISDCRVVLPKHPVYGYDVLMKHAPTSVVAPLLLLFKLALGGADLPEEPHTTIVDVVSEVGAEGLEQDSSPLASSQGNAIPEPAAEDFEENSYPSESGNQDSPIEPWRWTAEELCRGRRFNDPGLESSTSSSDVSGDSLEDDGEFSGKAGSDLGDTTIHGHLLLEATKHSPLMLSLLCVGEYATIQAIMASTLFQRRCLGLSHPVVGLMMIPEDCAIKVLFGWLNNSDDPLDLPCVMIVSPVTWVFNLLDPHHALSLAQFLFILDSHITEVVGAAKSFLSVGLEWRFDTIKNEISPSDFLWHNHEDKITSWIASTEFLHSPDPDLESDDLTSNWVNKRDDPNQSTQSTPSYGSTLPIVHSESDVQATTNHFQVPIAPELLAGNKPPTLEVWMVQRSALSYAFEPTQTKQAPSYEVYNKYTSLYYPEWIRSAEVMTDVRDQFLELQQQFRNHSLCVGEGLLPPHLTDLPVDISNQLKKKFSLLLHISQSVKKKKDLALDTGLLGVAVRSEWDILINEFIIPSNKISHHLEETMKLPFNEALKSSRNITAYEVFGCWGDHSLRLSRQLQKELKTDDQQPSSSPEANKIINTHKKTLADTSMALSNRLASNRVTINGLGEINPSSVIDPRIAKCDSLITLAIPDSFNTHDHSEVQKFSLMAQTGQLEERHLHGSALRRAEENRYNNIAASAVVASAIIKARCKGIPFQSAIPQPEKNTSTVLLLDESPTTALDGRVPDSQTDLHLPLLSVKHKIFKGQIDSNHGKLYSVACAKFLGAVGIKNLPIFTLITEGTIGVVTCTWFGEEALKVVGLSRSMYEVVQIYERNARAFDISCPLDALNFATFVGWISTAYTKCLQEEFEKIKPEFQERWKRGDPGLAWSMEHQFP